MENDKQVKTTNTQEAIGFVLSIICIALATITILIGTIAVVNIILAIATLAFGLVARNKKKTNKSLAIVIIGAASLLLGVIWLII